MTTTTREKVEEVLQFAIDNEQRAVDFYTLLASRQRQAGLKEMFSSLAAEEGRHKLKLEKIRSGRKLLKSGAKISRDIDLEDYATPPEPEGDLDLQDALLLAMKKEKAAFNLYMDMADAAAEPEVKDIFLSLAREEANHRARFEREYDRFVRPDN
ncbi:MAG: ferritin family protein [Elusimicrobia bacterium]|nr:ferritin family protein [Elusimicrobiota bacterium]